MKSLSIHLGVAFFCAMCVSSANADIVVRDAETSENEFHALAQALGHTPIADFLSNEADRKISNEDAELFRLRLFDAQAEWLELSNTLKKGGRSATPAVDRFLQLETEADWRASERSAFAAFAVRKAELSITDEAKSPSAQPVAFPSPLPTDVTAILVNGRPYSRHEFAAFRFPRSPLRLTLLSNVYLPETLKLSGSETDWPTIDRRSWVAIDCAVIPIAQVEKPLAIGSARCENGKPVASAPASDKTLIDKFGLERVSADVSPVQKPQIPAVMKKPWFWGVVGALAIGAVVAIERSQQPQSVRPTNNVGW